MPRNPNAIMGNKKKKYKHLMLPFEEEMKVMRLTLSDKALKLYSYKPHRHYRYSGTVAVKIHRI